MKKSFALVVAAIFITVPLVAHADGMVYNWVRTMGGSGTDYGFFISSDSSGNVYTGSHFQSTADFDPGPGTTNFTSVGGTDVGITKFDASGNLLWAKAIGSTGNEAVYSVNSDTSGNVYIVGGFQSTVDFDPGAGTVNVTSVGSDDIYILKLDSSGNFVWIKTVGGTGSDFARGLTFDGSGTLYITGYYTGTADFDPGAGVSNMTSAGSTDAFILKLDTSGNLISVKSFGGTGVDYIYGKTALDSSDNFYVEGVFQGTADFDPGAGTTNLTSNGNSDIFAAKFDSSGSLVWVKGVGGTAQDQARSLAVDTIGNVYIVGTFQSSTVDFDPGVGVYNVSLVGGQDGFILKLDSSGNFVWAGGTGGTSTDAKYSVITDSSGNVYDIGYFANTADFDLGAGVYNLTSAGFSDAYIEKFDSAGNLIWVKIIGGGVSDDAVFTLAANFSTNNLYAAGYFKDTVDFNPGTGVSNSTSNGDYDIFIGKYTLDTTAPSITINGAASISFFTNIPYVDQGATAADAVDGDITSSIVTTSNVDITTPGVYTVTYNVSDASQNSASPVTRTVTVLRRNSIAPLNLQINTGSKIPTMATSPSPSNVTKFVFTKNLKLGMRDPEVLELQKHLNSHGFPISLSGIASLGKETNYFGLATKSALIKFQKANNINPAVGFFGAMTRGYFNNKI